MGIYAAPLTETSVSHVSIYLGFKPQGTSVQGIYLYDKQLLKLHFLGLREINF